MFIKNTKENTILKEIESTNSTFIKIKNTMNSKL